MRVLLTGARGFIGKQLYMAMQAAGHAVTPVLRQGHPHFARAVVGDLRHVELTTASSQADVVVHAATVTAGAPADLWEGNVDATARLVATAHRSGATVIYISTTGVYGRSYSYFGDPEAMPRVPTSPLSQARAAAEDIVLQHGGTVIRPHVVYGPGDRWVTEPLARFMIAQRVWIGAADVAVAAITAQRLAEGVAALITRPLTTRVLHASEARPVPIRHLIQSHFEAARQPLPSRALSLEEAHRRLRQFGVSENAVQMVGTSSQMDARPFWGTQPANRYSQSR
jgi:nucleoside-diphosphate-sugar epimerase